MLRFVNNVGYTAFLAGDWDGALAELEGVLAEDLDRGDRISILSNALIVHACRGESVADGIAELERLGAEITDARWRIPVLDLEGNAGLAVGRLEDARGAWRELARLEPSQTPEFMYRAARPALWNLDRVAAQADLKALDDTGVHGRVVEIRRLTIRAGLAALDGQVAEALAEYREALRGWRELRVPWDEALTSVDMATLIDPARPEVQAAGESAREILSLLRASPFLARLTAALGRSGSTETAIGAAVEAGTEIATPS